MIDILKSLQTTQEKMLSLATEVKRMRKSKKISQKLLSGMSNVSYGSVKRFERTGEISLFSLIKILNSLKMRIELIDENPVLNKAVSFYDY